jgi:hypothetical protein
MHGRMNDRIRLGRRREWHDRFGDWLSVNVAVSRESIRISVVMSVLSRYTRYKNV